MIVRRSELAKKLFYLRGEPLTFENHRYMTDILDGNPPKLLLKTSRQIGKSTILSIRSGLEHLYQDLGRKVIHQLFVTPSHQQTKQFVDEKLRPLFYDSPKYRAILKSNKTKDNDALQTFDNGSMLFLRSAFRDAERVRGIPSDVVYIDEVQSMLESLIPIILSCMDASPYQRTIFTGTPLSMENPIQKYWEQSSQTEWLVPCNRHTISTGTGKKNMSKVVWNLLDEDNIGKKGLICKKCGERIYPSEGVWVDLNPGTYWKGYHVTQLAVELKQDPERWKDDILYKMEHWENAKFKNETLGESAGSAGKPLHRRDIEAICKLPKFRHWDTTKFHKSPPNKSVKWFAGVDWGEGREQASFEGGKKKNASFTHFIIGAYDNRGIFRLAYWKKFFGKECDPDFQVNFIVKACKKWNVELLTVDKGFGWGVNSRLFKRLGYDKVIQTVENSGLKPMFRYNEDSNSFTLNRPALISRLINDIKEKNIGFPKWEESRLLAPDFLAVMTEYNYTRQKLQYVHRADEPDDGFHTAMYAKFGADLKLNKIGS